jgi:hypothetical protein
MTKAPTTITYASVVSQETVCLALTIAALNDLEIKVGDVLMHILPHQLPKKYGQP